MYVYKRQVTMRAGIATLLAVALVLWAVGAHMFTTVEAAGLAYVKDTLSDSNPSTVSDHEINFQAITGVAATETITVTFNANDVLPDAFTGTSSILFSDVDFEINGVDETIVAGAPGAAEWGFTWSGDTMTLTAGASESMAALASGTIKIGTNADGPGVNQLTNPAAIKSYEIDLTTGTGGSLDTGHARVAIVDNVLVTADVPTTLTFTVSGVAGGATVNGSPTTTTDASTSNTLPFGTLTEFVSKTLAQDLTVATNARNGYVVTVEQDTNLESTVGADIDGFIDGAWTNTPAAWQPPGNNVLNDDTWGHWGLTSTDGDLQSTDPDFAAADTWVAASTTPRVIMAHSSASDGTSGTADSTGDDIGATRVGYQIEISALQEAGDDYSTVLTYIATPTF